jgi:thiol-disulfide isomerase/thioredoxin
MDHVSLKQSYPDYVTTYDKNVAKNITAIASISLAGKKASLFNYTSFSGQPVSLKAEKGKLILLDFWETWCGYCYLAMPRLKELQQKYKDQGLEIIGIVSENRKGVQQVLETQQFPYPTIYVDEKMLANYKVEARPTYFLIDDTGTIVEHSIGSLDKIEAAIKDWYKSK